ncbi:hypothetical protein [Tenacibaculum sp. L6]|uniref:hypothetical protein n=1 Tax=Tenacibaculum sp. L6 TaxID=2992764 RepID=UPI00237B0AF0|nr:hypothetical protein [Tenacibaculum sp. L6]MDE0535415.1 hypothetical protein [Tenacibaculum sp. L6]
MKTITNKLKVALVAVGFLAMGTVSAQTTDPSDGRLDKDADATKVVRLIDNKGTIKYVQSKNGITQITSTNGANRTTTTWQLGGTLTDNTYITADAGTEFALNGLQLITDVTTASTNAQDRGDHNDGLGATGFTVLIRDEATGAIQKMQLSDLLEVQGSQHVYAAAEIVDTANPSTLALSALPGAPQNLVYQKVSVYRNGAKLVANVDYIVVNGATAADSASITLQPQAAVPSDWEVYAGDIIEVHWIK